MERGGLPWHAFCGFCESYPRATGILFQIYGLSAKSAFDRVKASSHRWYLFKRLAKYVNQWPAKDGYPIDDIQRRKARQLLLEYANEK